MFNLFKAQLKSSSNLAFLNPWTGDMVDSVIGLSSQGLRIWLLGREDTIKRSNTNNYLLLADWGNWINLNEIEILINAFMNEKMYIYECLKQRSSLTIWDYDMQDDF